MQLKRKNIKGRRTSGSFLALPHNVLNHPDFISLSPRAIKLLIDLAAQFKGKNNGDLCATFSMMKKRGWNSNDQLKKATDELIQKSLLQLSRQGGRHCSNLYALTWKSIDECDGKLDIEPTRLAPRSFK